MEKHDYVTCSWCKIDDIPDFEYHYFCVITHNQAVNEAKFYSNQQTLRKYKDLIYQEVDKRIGISNGFAPNEFVDAYEEIMNEFQCFKVWKVLPEIPIGAYDEYCLNPESFCDNWCERVV